MAVMIVDEEHTDVVPYDPGITLLDLGGLSDYSDPYNITGIQGMYMNKAWHTASSVWVPWITAAPDPSGNHYPGPDTIGDTTDYRVQSIVYTLNQ